ncbi:thiol reductant ABC exporter subunit CydC [Williamsia sp. CHRR-6]|uniref:thiol reductant ABC exporter subunit CydC n=1 Tax=Williamsia sp. CHRR-6 TaxID=2835871 RepID=UPI001BDAA20E|nr:thiol reductant ABC exporter subunit CydC [Williamsia sp. CHRR-6]MBT0566327.1 thiol reductant ABC exporter subunit CydC [Williamsia sp. CHRR-6]
MSERRHWRADPAVRAAALLGVAPGPVLRSVALGSASSLSALALAVLSAWLITRAWQMPPVLALSVAVTSVRALGISRALFRYLERLATHDLALDAMATARSRIYAAVAGGSPSYSVTLRRSEIVSRAGDDIEEIGDALIRGLIPLGSAVVTATFAVGVGMWVSPWLGSAVALGWVVAGVLAPVLAAVGAARAERDDRCARDDAGELAALLLWHGPEMWVAGRREELLAAARAAQLRAVRAADCGNAIRSWAAAAVPVVVGAVVLVACLLAVGMADRVDATTVGVLILLPLSAFEAASGLVDAARHLWLSRQAGARVLAMIDCSGVGSTETRDISSVDRPTATGDTALHATAVRFGYSAHNAVGPICGIETIGPGARIAVVGASGCGKTSLLLTLAGLLPPLAGTVQVVGGNAAAGEVVRYFAEDAHVFATTVRENLLVANGSATDTQCADALGRVGLGPWLTGLPDGLDTILAAGTEAISAGQRRRLLLARVVINPAPIVLLDEPCEHLDRTDADRLHRELLDRDSGLVAGERAVVVVAHHLPAETAADVVIDLDAARADPVDQLTTKSVAEDQIPA